MAILARGGVPAAPPKKPSVETKPGGQSPIPLVGQGKAGGTVAPEVGEEQSAISQMEREEEKTAAVGAKAKQEEVH